MPSLPTLPIAALADRSGIDVETIKTYQRMGLLSRPRRANGLLLYPPEEVERIALVNSAIGFGFSVPAVRQLLGVGRKGRLGCDDVYVIAERHLAEIRRRRADLERIERLLAPLVETCPRTGPRGRCNIIAALSHRRRVDDPRHGKEGASGL
jgi:MerR family mercuric resistance operon transcriptional regulator